jgi:Tol biopolymer transport system component
VTVAPGSRLGPYEVSGKLGEGGMGEVWRATDSRLRREVAIKVLPAAFTADPERLARFEREAQTLAALNHSNIAAIYGLEEADGTRALVMELVEGEDLAARIARGPLPVEDALGIARQIAEALEAAHAQGIVHRDLKPANVKVRADGTVKVLDFGLAKAMEPAGAPAGTSVLAHSPTLTGTRGTELGVILGTAAYMAPEQARGGAVDERADLWALGVILHEMLTGRRLFEGKTVSDTLAAVLRGEIDLDALPPDTPAEVRRLLRRCLERNAKNRLHHAADVRIVLDDVLAGRVTEGAAPGASVARVAPRRTALVLAAAAAAVLLAVAMFWVGRRAGAGDAAGAGGAAAPAPRPVRFEQLTDSSGIESAPSLSPDGRDVVFTRVVDGRPEIMIQRVGARVATSLTGGSGADDIQPAFSPDGERIAFRSERDGGGIFLMDTSGEAVRRLSDSGFHPTWSPDGRELAVANGSFLWPTDRGGAVRGLWAIDVSTGARREISRAGDTMQPRWSPNGHRIAFWGLRDQTGQRDLYTVAADGSELESQGLEVTNDAALDWSPTWSPDGRFLYFSSNRGGTMNLWRVPIEEASGRTLGPPEPVTTPSHWVGELSFSRDGKRLAFASVDWRTTLYRAELDAAAGRLAGPPTPLLKGTQPIRDHRLSPDGEWLVFMRLTAQEDLFVARTDGSRSRRLTDDPYRDRGPAWSPDGGRIAFYSDRGGSYQLWLIRPDGSGLEQVTAIAEGTTNFPVWSPDGRRLAFSAIPGGGQMIDLAAGTLPAKPEPLRPMEKDLAFWPFSWSADGRRLAGIAVRGSGVNEGLAIHDLDGGSYELLGFGGNAWGAPSWLSDGRRLLARDGRGVWLLVPGEEPRLLVAVGGYGTGLSVGVSGDDRWLTWSETGSEGDVWMAELE